MNKNTDNIQVLGKTVKINFNSLPLDFEIESKNAVPEHAAISLFMGFIVSDPQVADMFVKFKENVKGIETSHGTLK